MMARASPLLLLKEPTNQCGKRYAHRFPFYVVLAIGAGEAIPCGEGQTKAGGYIKTQRSGRRSRRGLTQAFVCLGPN